METNKKFTPSISTIVQVGSPFIILLATIFRVSYYSIFNISIIEYLELNELLTYFLNFISLGFVVALLFFIFLLSFNRNAVRNANDLLEKEGKGIDYDQRSKWVQIRYEFTHLDFAFKTVLGLSGFFGIISIVFKAFSINGWELMGIISTIVFGVSGVGWLILIFLFNKFQSRYSPRYFRISSALLIMFLLCVNVYSIGRANANYVLNKKDKKSIVIINGNDQISCGNDTLFIGKSNKYLFFYVISKQEPVIISVNSDLKIGNFRR